jgi:hypothetical protein
MSYRAPVSAAAQSNGISTLGMAAGSDSVHSRNDAFKVHSDARPFRRASQDQNGNRSAGQILLIANSAVGCEQKFDSFCFRGFQ